MADLADLDDSLDGAVFRPGSPGYASASRPVGSAFREVLPRLVVQCGSVRDVARVIRYATTTGERVAPRGGGHCFAGRSSTDGIVLDLSGLDGVSVAGDGVATVGAGARLDGVYAALHARGRALPAGCGPTVGIAGLTLGGGIGLLGRAHGLTCDHLVGARVVLADGRVVDCDHERDPDLFWGLRGAGGGQFGVVTSLRFATVPEPICTRVEAHWSGVDLDALVAAWQSWAPDAPDGLTVNLDLVADPGSPVRARLLGAATLGADRTRALLGELLDQAGLASTAATCSALPYHVLKRSLADPRDEPERVLRTRSELFAHAMTDGTRTALLTQLDGRGTAGRRQLAFTAMGGAYDRVAADATAFAHRGERFLLEHIADATDPWVDRSWSTAHRDGSGHVYPNFPDPALDDPAPAYHAGNHPRLVAIKNTYDPHRFFDFPQAV